MDAVRAFNNELSSLYESKPPVSRAKMAQITKCAIKAIKFYKHVVQSVEKFIQKCKPEYKVPGLYVIDSIVRQSRHQFGPEKDVFSPRFTKNIITTFTNMLKCPVEERSRIVRVLNLWQKNCVFPEEILQPLLDLAADPDNSELVSAAQKSVDSVVGASQKVPLPAAQLPAAPLPAIPLPAAQPSSNGGDPSSIQILQQSDMLGTITKLLKQAQEGTITPAAPESQLQKLQNLQQHLVMRTERISKPQQPSTPPIEATPSIDSNLLAQIQVLTNHLLNKPSGGVTETVEETNKQIIVDNHNIAEKQYSVTKQNSMEPLFNKKLLEFDYGDSDEDDDREDHHHHHQHYQQSQPTMTQPIMAPPTVAQHTIAPPTMTQPTMAPPTMTQPTLAPPTMTQPTLVPLTMTQPTLAQPTMTQLTLAPPTLAPPTMTQPLMAQPTMTQQQCLPPVMPEQSLLQKIQQISQQQEQLQSDIGAQDQLRRRLLEQQQEQLQSDIGAQDQLRRRLLEQQQEQVQSESGAQDQLRRRLLEQQQEQVQSESGTQDQLRRRLLEQQQEQLQSESGAQDQLRRRLLEQQQQQFDREIEQESLMSHQPSGGFSQDQDKRPDDDQDDRNNRENHDRVDHRRQRESKDKSRSPRRRSRRSRSRSRDRDRRRRSRSRDRHRRSRSRERERREREKEREKERERERERRKVGLPPLKSNNIGICSTTLWLGRLTKYTTENELREHIEKYGTIRTINMIPPRGCAFVCLTKRKDANKVLDRLKGFKINGSAIKIAWAPGIGVKESAYKDSWDVDLGVTYIPWSKLPKDVAPLLAGGMVDEESLPEKLKGMKTGEEEEEEIQPQQNPSVESGEVPDENKMIQQHPQIPLPLGQPPPPRFHLPGHNPLNLMGPGGPLSLLSGPPPPIGIPPGMGTPLSLGGPSNMGGHNNMNNMGNLNIGALAGHRVPGPNLPGMGPPQMNLGPQGAMMGGPGAGLNSGMETFTSLGPRGPFGQFGNIPRFPQMQNPGGMRPFVNNGNNGGDQAGMGDSDMRAMVEPIEWPPDDEVNAEDESDDYQPMDSDERILPMGRQHHMPGPGMPNLRGFGNPFGLRGHMLPAQGSPNPMLGIPRAPSPGAGMPSLISLRMMPPHQQQQVLTVPGGSAPGFALPPGAVRLPMPAVGMRQGPVPTVTSPHLLPPSTGAPISVAVSVNGSVVVTRPVLSTSNAPISIGGTDKPAANSEVPPSEDDRMDPGPLPVMQIHGGNHTPCGPVLGRGFSPMTIRPRGGAGLLGVRPGAQGGGGFNRFGGPRPLMGPAFGEMDRPPFGNRFGVPLRPPAEFLDLDDRDDRDGRRPLPRIDIDDHVELGDVIDQNLPKDIDERRESKEVKVRNQDIDMRQDIDERSKPSRASGRPSRWCDAGEQDEASKSLSEADQNIEGKPTNTVSSGKVTESSAISAPLIEGTPTPMAVHVATDIPSADTQTSVIVKTDLVAVVEKNEGLVDKIVSGGGDAIQPIRSNDTGEKTSS